MMDINLPKLREQDSEYSSKGLPTHPTPNLKQANSFQIVINKQDYGNNDSIRVKRILS
jgi:hypothetical protein